jgi:hypothetical protein
LIVGRSLSDIPNQEYLMSRSGANWSKTSAAQDRELGTIWLQGVGRVRAKPASEFRSGEKIMWNEGATSKVISITPSPSGKQVRIIAVSEGISSSRDFKGSRLLAIG